MRAKVIKVEKFDNPMEAGPLDTFTLVVQKHEMDKDGKITKILSTTEVHKQGFTKRTMIVCWALISISGNPGYVVGDMDFYDECCAELNYQEVTEELSLTEHQHGK